jgi:serine/threonine protein kinase
MTAAVGQLLGGRYRLLALLGQGGMGVVWHAHDDLLSRDVAVKEVLWPPQLSASEQQVLFRRTVREARAAARLNHPAAVTVFDVLEEAGRPWIVMEFVRSRSLAQAVDEDGPLPPSEAARIGLEVLGALAAAHAAGILHRDVKPSNVLLAQDGRVVLTDFGIAALHGDPALTASGALMGSPAYIAPERARGGQAEPASDLWSLGVTLYAAVEGRTPHERGGAMPTLLAVTTEEPDPPRRAGPLAPVLEGLLQRDPASRLNADDTAPLLGAIAAGPGQGPRPDLPAPTARLNLTDEAQTPTRTLGPPSPAPGSASTVPSAVPPATRRPPMSAPAGPEAAPAGPGDPAGPRDPGRRTPRRRYVALLAALAGLVAVGVIAAVLLMPGHPKSRPSPPATSHGSASSPAPSAAASPQSSEASSPSSAATASAGSVAPSTSPAAAPSTSAPSQPTATGAGSSP